MSQVYANFNVSGKSKAHGPNDLRNYRKSTIPLYKKPDRTTKRKLRLVFPCKIDAMNVGVSLDIVLFLACVAVALRSFLNRYHHYDLEHLVSNC